jgi:hypothetical protein
MNVTRLLQVPGVVVAAASAIVRAHRLIYQSQARPHLCEIPGAPAPCSLYVHAATPNQSLENRYTSRIFVTLFISLELVGAIYRFSSLLKIRIVSKTFLFIPQGPSIHEPNGLCFL